MAQPENEVVEESSSVAAGLLIFHVRVEFRNVHRLQYIKSTESEPSLIAHLDDVLGGEAAREAVCSDTFQAFDAFQVDRKVDESLLTVFGLTTLSLSDQLIKNPCPDSDCTTFALELGQPDCTTPRLVHFALKVS